MKSIVIVVQIFLGHEVGAVLVIGFMILYYRLSGVIAKETKKYSGSHINDLDNTPIPTLKNADKGILG